MRSGKRIFSIIVVVLFHNAIFAQSLYNNGADIKITDGGLMYVDGTLQNESGQIDLDNASLNSELIIQGDFVNNATALGDGYIRLYGDWLNNNIFTAGSGTVFLEGGNQQLGGSVSTAFNNLTLDGTGLKTQSIDQYCSGVLDLTTVELQTETYGFFVENVSTSAITRVDGFVSSLNGGFLSRNTNQASPYLFPVGSSVGTSRYRPVEITPENTTANTYKVRMANVDANSEGFDRSLLGSGICEINPLFYHQIDRSAGTAGVDMNIYFDMAADGDFEGISNWNVSPNQWEIITGSTTTTGTPLDVASATSWNDFSQLAYGLYISTPNVVAGGNTPICQGDDINLTETGGDATSWSWSGPDTFSSADQNPVISSATTAAGGTYTVTVTDAAGCTASDNVNITVNPTPLVNAGSNSPLCEGDDINLTETGGDATSWNWSGPGTFASAIQNPTVTAATPSESGIYSVTITDANGCTAESTTDVTVNATPAATAGSNSPICEGGDINLTETGGAATSWSWSGPGTFTSAFQNPTITAATPSVGGTYSVTITDANGCTATATTDVNVYTNPAVNASSNSPVCEGGDITLSETGGAATSWSWSGPDSFTSTAQNPVISGVSLFDGGTYNVTISDANGCTATDNTSVVVNKTPAAMAGSNSPVCEGSDINLTETGGDATSWSWDGPNAFTSSQQNPTITAATPTESGTYGVTITDVNGCTATSTTDVTVNATPTATAGSNSPICEGGDINLAESGGDASSWSWSGPDGFISTQQNPTISGVTSANDGLYTVTVTDGNGCTATSDVDVTINPTPSAIAGSNTPVCEGEDINLSETGGSAVSWNWDGPGTFTSSLQNPTVTAATLTESGTYSVTVIDASGCTATATADVTVNATPVATAISNSPVCEGGDINLGETGGSATAWSWSGPDAFASTQQNPTISGATTASDGLYTVTVTDGNGCTATSNADVTVNPTPIATAGSNSPVCEGGDINLAESGGDASSWSWSGPDGFTSTQQNPTISGVTSANDGLYTVTVTDGNGCTATSDVDVTINPTPSAIAGSNSPVCEGGDINLSETGGNATSWSWTGPDGFASVQQNPVINTAGTINDGLYTVVVSDVNGCTASNDVDVTVHTTPAINPESNSPVCEGGDINLNETGAAASSWSWSGPNSFSSAIQNPVIAAVSLGDGGTYSVTITDVNGCTASGSTDVVVNKAPAALTGSNSPVCEGDDINLTESGGDADTWSWSGPDGFTSTAQNPTITSATTVADGTYSITITDANGCTATNSTSVTVHTAPMVTIGSNSPICSGDNLNLTESGGSAASWSWSGPDGFSSALQNPSVTAATTAADGLYSVTITDANTCTATADVDVTVNPAPATPTVSVDCSGGVDAGIISVTSPLGPEYEYSIDGTWQATTDFGPLVNGTYTVTVTNVNNGCTTAGSPITLDCGCSNPPTLSLSANSGAVCETSPITLSGNSFGGSATEVNLSHDGNGSLDQINFNTTPFEFTYTPSPLDQGNIVTITISTDNPLGAPCAEAQDSYSLTVNPLPGIIGGSNSPICEGGDINLNETGGEAVIWSWSGPDGFTASVQNPTVTNATTVADGTYSLTITDVNGCTATATTDVTVHDTPTATADSNSPLCEGSDINLTETGGSATSWSWSGPDAFTSSQQNPTITAATPTESGTYSVTITDVNGCTATSTTDVTVNATPTATAGSNSPICEGGDINLTETAGEATSWSWDGPGTFTSALQNPTVTAATPSEGGTYSVTITDVNGCTAAATTDVIVNPSPATPTVSVDCSGGVDAGIISVTAPLGAEYEYSIDGSWQATTDFGPLANGTYTVTVTNINTGCISSGSPISLDCGCSNPPMLSLSANSDAVCEATAVTLSGNTFSGSATLVNLTHDGNGSLNQVSFNTTPFEFTYTPDPLDEGSTVTVTLTTDNPLGAPCAEAQDTYSITVNPAPTATAGSNSPICEGGDINLTETGGEATSWSWSGPDGYVSSEQNPVIASPATAADGTYTVEISDSNGCIASADVDVVVNPQPALNMTCTSPVCEGEDINLTENGGDAVAWSWVGPEGFTADDDSPVISPATTLHNGNYNCSITDANGCSASGSIAVVVHSMPDVNIVDTNALCSTSSPLSLEASPEDGVWSGNGITDASAGVFDPSEANIGINTITYEVTENGCTASDQIEMEIVESLDASITDPGYFCSDDATIQLQTADDGGSWSGEAVDDSGYFDPNDVGPGEYQVVYTIDQYCGSTDTLLITVYERADATITGAPDSLFINDPSVIVYATDQGGIWSGHGIDEVSGEFIPFDAGLGSHQIIYTIAEMCGDSDTTNIVVSEEVIADLKIPDVFTPNDDGYNDTWEIQGIEAIPNVEIFIVTRWGDQVFEYKGSGEGYADASARWDGTYNGRDLPFGTYVYVLKFSDGEIHKGTVSIVR